MVGGSQRRTQTTHLLATQVEPVLTRLDLPCCLVPCYWFLVQFDYEYCMRNNNVTACLVEDSVINALFSNFTENAAGFANPSDYTFLDHEWFKHGSCKPLLLRSPG